MGTFLILVVKTLSWILEPIREKITSLFSTLKKHILPDNYVYTLSFDYYKVC